MADALPAPTLGSVDELATALSQWMQTHCDTSLATHEAGVLDAVRRVLPVLLGAVVQASTTALVPAQ